MFRAAQVGQTARSRFPVRSEPGHRYLVDREGKPFLVQATPWSLIAELKRNEVDEYLADRARRGFNTLLVNLLEHRFATRHPPMPTATLRSRHQATTRLPTTRTSLMPTGCSVAPRLVAFLVLLAPSYVGSEESPEGWWDEMVRAGQRSYVPTAATSAGATQMSRKHRVGRRGRRRPSDRGPRRRARRRISRRPIPERPPDRHTRPGIGSTRVWGGPNLAGRQQRLHVQGRLRPLDQEYRRSSCRSSSSRARTRRSTRCRLAG